jgi:hypothetical protein
MAHLPFSRKKQKQARVADGDNAWELRRANDLEREKRTLV